jgi:hypothetical protein
MMPSAESLPFFLPGRSLSVLIAAAMAAQSIALFGLAAIDLIVRRRKKSRPPRSAATPAQSLRGARNGCAQRTTSTGQ